MQQSIERIYGAHTGIDVRAFVRSLQGLDLPGQLLVEQNSTGEDLNVALLLDRDILQAWESAAGKTQSLSAHEIAVPCEEVSHFVYLSWNHARGRNITGLEMEIQSEIDRIVLAFHGQFNVAPATREALLQQLLTTPYQDASYETARVTAAKFIHRLAGGRPEAWTPMEFQRLCEFFHGDLQQKMHLSREGARRG
ncbi:MAG: hypothetical protein JST16_17320 [Bdellovibrionales bacterium]|nr:hypothetical protein [Bdellovibrionales bacterium]